MNPADVTACLVTRGDVDMKPILDTLIFSNVIVWDNSKRQDFATYGRFAAMAGAPTDTIYFQDDDVIVHPDAQQELLDAYKRGTLVSNMPATWHPQYPELAWLGFGSIVDRNYAMAATGKWADASEGKWFRLVGCDIFVGTLIPHTIVDAGYQLRDFATDRTRVYGQEGFEAAKRRFYEQALAIKGGIRLNLGCGPERIDGYVNLDATNGWRFEHGLPYPDGSVEAITESHALMYVDEEDWPFVFSEFARVLSPDGVIRITEDDALNPDSERFGGYPDAVTLTGPEKVRTHLSEAGLNAWNERPDATEYKDESIIQRHHGDPPKVFFVEAKHP